MNGTVTNGNLSYGTQKQQAVGKSVLGSQPSPEASGKKPLNLSRFIRRNAFVITLVLSSIIDGLSGSVRSQYRYRFFHSQYASELKKYNASKECGVQLTPQVQEIEDQISKETSQWNMYHSYATIVPMMVSSVVLGMKSDQLGRRFLFLLPMFMSLLTTSALTVIIRLNLHVAYMLIGDVLSSMTGGGIGMHFAAYAVITDTHGKKKPASKDTKQPNTGPTEAEADDDEIDISREHSRTIKIVLLGVVRKLSGAGISFATGYIIQYAGFFYSLIIVIGVKLGIFLFAFTLVEETGQQKKSAGFLAPLKIIFRKISDPWKRRILLLVNLGQLFCILGFVCEMEVLHVYQMSPPFCMDAVQLGWYSGESRMKGIFSIPILWLWRRLGLNEVTIAAIGMASDAAATFFLASIRQLWVFFVAPLISIPGSLAMSMTQIITSRIVGRSALASTFAVMMAIEEVFNFCGGLASNYLYQQSLHTLPSAPIYLAGAYFTISTAMFVIQIFLEKCSPTEQVDADNLESSVQKPQIKTA